MSEEPKNIKANKKLKARKVLSDLTGKRLTRTHMSELSQAMVGIFEGADGLASELLLLYHKCANQPGQQVRIMGMIVGLVTNDTQMSGKQSGMDEQSDEDIETELNELLGAEDDGEETE